MNALYARTTLKGDYFVTGGKDGVIKLWNLSLHCVKAFNMRESRPPPRHPAVRSVCLNDVGNTILVGTHGSELFEITNIQATADITGATLLQRGHFAFELWGLAPHPHDPDVYATVGDDCTLRVWSAEHRRPNHEMAIETMSRAVVWHPTGDYIAMGLGGHTRRGRSNKDGSFLIVNTSTWLVEHEGRDSREWITDIKYSPDGKMLAMSSNDNMIYLYNAEDGYPLIAKCEKHSASVRHLDFTKNGAYIQVRKGAGMHQSQRAEHSKQARTHAAQLLSLVLLLRLPPPPPSLHHTSTPPPFLLLLLQLQRQPQYHPVRERERASERK